MRKASQRFGMQFELNETDGALFTHVACAGS